MPLTCNGCLHAPVSLLAVFGRTYADRSRAPGHVLRLLCGECAGKTREICERGGRAVSFLAVAAVPEGAPLSRLLVVDLSGEDEALASGKAVCDEVVSEEEDPEEGPRGCGKPSVFIVARSDGDKSYGVNGGTGEACEGHLAEVVAGMVEGDENIRAVVTIRWDDPEGSDSR